MMMPTIDEIVKKARAIHEQLLVSSLGHNTTEGSCLYAAVLLASVVEKFSNCKVVTIRGGDGRGDGGYRDAAGNWHGHYWVELNDGSKPKVVDITADQFGGPKVVVVMKAKAGSYLPGDQHTVNAHVAEETVGLVDQERLIAGHRIVFGTTSAGMSVWRSRSRLGR